ncbi:hypothetical protein [Aeromonas phage 4L372D]|uniref:Uncharacterized protein n=4 Tax=Plateaulakevirus TaxID=2843436 RepID=A0A5B9NCE4_9CAUD|nr:hypothetical protein HWC25_gp045 [Aeromonas phage 2L372D]YP_009846378.1 hypothetical protein HWC26_gp041 [Aeromonas phage 2L372X]YP_009846617.1 hypothetical protein HWC27_gp069 [Aeromonas phage 4L372D]YP_009846843.1 hypothetical protein HWC28_gp044 [Aeromonas phage 4L372XY]QDB73959.1 hypothetical protein 2L372D_045 [Aeromonas phage 2L372D]QEG08293.1 hypothetical protein [Aeromonas phage 2L372X]QEG08533.1 hypothetical protein [Aeromonas phage 4L372D]QEG08759.1 hypothetical protein [Aeromon
MDYKNLEQEIKERKDKLTRPSWRGDLSRKGLDNIQFGDLNYIQNEVLNKQKCEIN